MASCVSRDLHKSHVQLGCCGPENCTSGRPSAPTAFLSLLSLTGRTFAGLTACSFVIAFSPSRFSGGVFWSLSLRCAVFDGGQRRADRDKLYCKACKHVAVVFIPFAILLWCSRRGLRAIASPWDFLGEEAWFWVDAEIQWCFRNHDL